MAYRKSRPLGRFVQLQWGLLRGLISREARSGPRTTCGVFAVSLAPWCSTVSGLTTDGEHVRVCGHMHWETAMPHRPLVIDEMPLGHPGIKEFAELPWKLYRCDPYWTPPLGRDLLGSRLLGLTGLLTQRHPYHKHADAFPGPARWTKCRARVRSHPSSVQRLPRCPYRVLWVFRGGTGL